MIQNVKIFSPAGECMVFTRGESVGGFYTYYTDANYKSGIREIKVYPKDWVFAETLRKIMHAARRMGYRLEVQTA